MEQTAIEVSNYDKIKALAANEKTIERFAAILGSKREAQAYITSAMLAVANSPDLMQCTPSSIFNAVMRAATLRLFCDPALGQAHIVPYNTKVKGKNGQPDRWAKTAQFIPGYIGLNNLAARSGKYRYLNAGALYEGQEIKINQLTGAARITGLRKNQNIIGYFHYFEMRDGYSHTLYMTVEELREHGEKYAPKNPLWKTNFHAMALKTVTRLNLLKHAVLEPSDRKILDELSEERPEGEPINTIDGEFTELDNQVAEVEAQQRAEEAASRPRRSEAEIMADLGFEPIDVEYRDEPKPEPEPAAPEEPQSSISLETAENITNSDGIRYGDLDSGKLSLMTIGINRALKKDYLTDGRREELQLKLDAIAVILKSRAQN